MRHALSSLCPTVSLVFLVTIVVAAFAAAGALAQPVTFTDASNLLQGFNHTSVPAGGDGLAGAAWFDYDNDGDQDLFLTNGRGGRHALFQNNGGTFTDVAGPAGVQGGGQGSSGVIAADLDNDGDQDLFLTGDGGFMGVGDSPITLFANNGNGTFTNVTAGSGITPPTTHLGAAFGDLDNDGLLDLFIAASGSLCLGGPPCVPGVHTNGLYRNLGGLTFQNISATSGVATALGACAAVFDHYDNDPFIDLFVVNCNNNIAPPGAAVGIPIPGPGQVFRNNGNQTFTDLATQPLSPAMPFGSVGLWMGIAPADFDNDLDIDFFVTNLGPPLPPFPTALHAYYLKSGTLCPTTPGPGYANVASVLFSPFLRFGWGATAQDFDNDAFTDLFFAGALPQAGYIGPTYGNPGTLHFNNLPAALGFTDWSASLPGTINLANKFSSGVAAADFDADGDVDVVVATDAFGGVGGQPVLLRNRGSGNNYLTVRLLGTTSNLDAIGARIAVGNGATTMYRGVYAGSSFLSMDSQWQTFGMGTATITNLLAVWWPSNLIESFPNVAANQTITLVEGTGTPLPPCP